MFCIVKKLDLIHVGINELMSFKRNKILENFLLSPYHHVPIPLPDKNLFLVL